MPWRKLMADIPFEGVFRRQIDLMAWDEGTVVGWLEDECHHFGITLSHDGHRVTGLRVAAPRYPWATCAGVGAPLQALVGQPLVARCSDIGALVDMRRQCTHVFDLAGLALAHAYAGRGHRRYHGTVCPLADAVPGGATDLLRATLYRDGQAVMHWDLDGDVIVGPEPYTGVSINRGFRQWAEKLDGSAAEDASVLRRVAFVAKGRRISIRHARVAADMKQSPVCHSFQPAHRDVAFRIGDTDRRFDQTPEKMLALVHTQP